jgi:outer membrane protein assembly factor BamB
VWDRPDGVTEVIIGGFDGLVYFLDGDTGDELRAPFTTGFQIKGTGALDPDGHPLYYTGSRDGRFRILALDREPVVELWGMDAHPQRVWNNDWDGSPAIVDDLLLVGGEDSWFRAVRLNRAIGPDGLVTVDPEVLAEVPGFDDALFAAVGDRNVSIENSVAVDLARDRVAFANSGGRVLVLGLGALRRGETQVLLDVWLGDDIDASLVIDPDDGAIYAAIELQRFLPRAAEVGQLVRLDPDRADDPIVWGIDIPPRRPDDDGGAWATPALYDGLLYVATHPGELLVVDTEDGGIVFRDELGWHAWSSPVVVEDPSGASLLVATCTDPHLRAYDLADPRRPVERWRLALPGCIESTPAVWDGRIWVGSRDGFFYAIR